MTGVLIRRGESGRRPAGRRGSCEDTGGRERGGRKEERQRPRSWRRPEGRPQSPQAEATLPAPQSWTSGPQNWERINFPSCKPPRLGCLVTAAPTPGRSESPGACGLRGGLGADDGPRCLCSPARPRREILRAEHVTLSRAGWGGGDPSCPHVFPFSLITGFPPKTAPQPSPSCSQNPPPDSGPLHSCRPHRSPTPSPCLPLLGRPFPRSPLRDCSSPCLPSVRRALRAGAGLRSAGGARCADVPVTPRCMGRAWRCGPHTESPPRNKRRFLPPGRGSRHEGGLPAG